MSNHVQKLYECQWTQKGCAPAKVTARACLIQQVTKKPQEGTSTWYPCATCETGQKIIRENPALKKSIDDHIQEHGKNISRRQQGLSSFPFYPTNSEGFAGIKMTSGPEEHPQSPLKSSQDLESPALISKYGPSILMDLDSIIKKEGSATRRSLLDRLKMSIGSLKYHLKNLEKAGFIVITPGRWATDEIKIDFSEKGRAYLISRNGGHAAGPADPAPPDLPKPRTCKKHGLPLKLSGTAKSSGVAINVFKNGPPWVTRLYGPGKTRPYFFLMTPCCSISPPTRNCGNGWRLPCKNPYGPIWGLRQSTG
jgi:hypothetical protein